MLTCKDLIDFLMDYTDGHLSPEARAEFDRHLKVCPSCVAYLDSYTRTVALAKQSCRGHDDEPVSTSVPKALVQAILEAQKNRQDA